MSAPPHVEWQQRWNVDAVATTEKKVNARISRGVVLQESEAAAPNLFVLTLSPTDAAAIKETVPADASTVLKTSRLHIVTTDDSIDQTVYRVDCLYNGVIVDSVCSSHCPYELFRRNRQQLAPTGRNVEVPADVALPYYFEQQPSLHFPINLDTPASYQFIVYCKDEFEIGSNDFYVEATICTRYNHSFFP